MADFNRLIALLDKTVDDFSRNIPGIEQALLDRLRLEINGLELRGGNVAISGANVRRIASIKSRLMDIILSPEYINQVTRYARAFTEVTEVQNKYFNTITKDFSPPDLTDELKRQAVEAVVDRLTESGIEANIAAGVDDILRTYITSGGSYSDLQRQLEKYIAGTGKLDGQLQKYTRQITVDSINQYSAQYAQLVSSDLGLEWFRYVGSNIETSRPFCKACTKKDYIHISEIPALLAGDFPEFHEFDGVLYRGLPSGMYPETTVGNFPILRGGYNCRHMLYPVSESSVPKAVRDAIYATEAYKAWAAGQSASSSPAEQTAQGEVPASIEKPVDNQEQSPVTATDLDQLVENLDRMAEEIEQAVTAEQENPDTNAAKVELEQVKLDTPAIEAYTAENGAAVEVSPFADRKDLESNYRAARVITDELAIDVRIRPHIDRKIIPGKNPEYEILGTLADLKVNFKQGNYKAINTAFKEAKLQGVGVIVFDFTEAFPKLNIYEVNRWVRSNVNANRGAWVSDIIFVYKESAVRVTRDQIVNDGLVEELKKIIAGQ